ncbi:MAG TPA: FtsQ-type POTRA domain-containing protein [Kofleriaceae bacterium]
MPRPTAIADACGRALRRALPAMIVMLVLATIGGTAWAGYRFVTTSQRFAIAEIQVNGVHHLTDDQVRAALTVRAGDNVFATSLDEIVRELRENPWIASAEAHRVLPHTIVIDVREHVPAAVVQLGTLYLVDAEGHPFKRAELGGDEAAGLPIITGLDRTAYLANPAATAAQIKGAMAALHAWRSVDDRPSIGEVHLDAHGALTLVTYEQAISIQLGELDDQLDERMQTFDATWAVLSSAERTRTRAIHLDARADQVTVAFAPTDNT